MDYEKKYKEALERAKKFEEKYGGGYAGYIFPELAQSEDEMVRQELIEYLRGDLDDITTDDTDRWIAYLEKQKGKMTAEEFESSELFQLKLKTKYANWYQDGLAQKEQKSVDYDHEMWKNCEANFEGGKKEVIEHPEKYGLQKPAEWSEVKFPKDIEKDATQFCFDKGINITPHQAKEIATHYLMVGHNEGYVEGRKNAHIPARELGLPSSMDFKQGWSEEDEKIAKEIEEELWYPGNFPDYPSKEESELYDDCQRRLNWFKDKLKSIRPQPKVEWSEEDEKTRRNLMSLLSCMRGDRITEETYQKYYPWLKSLRPSWKPNDEDEDSKNSK